MSFERKPLEDVHFRICGERLLRLKLEAMDQDRGNR